MCCEFDYSKLRGKIIEKYGTQLDFAKALNIPYQKVSKTLNSKRAMDQTEIAQWAVLLGICVSDYGTYFFTTQVHERE